ncbi:MAG: TSUP family transporter [Blautia sp.]|nr:TSUP family transporter [Blautia sp.]
MEWIWYIIAALGAGIGTGLAGLSAATVMVPILIVLCPSFAGETGAYQATAIALASDILGSAVTTYTYARHKNIALKRGWIMLVCILAMCTVGSYVAFIVGNVVLGSFTLFLTFFIGIRFLVKPDTSRKNTAGKGEKLDWKGVVISLFFGLTIGFGTGFVGTGGGMMMLLCIAVATVASLLSARFANRVNNRTVGLVTGAVLTVLGASMLILNYWEILSQYALFIDTLRCLGVLAAYIIPCVLVLLPVRFLTKIPSFIFRKLLHIVAFSCVTIMTLTAGSWQSAALAAVVIAALIYPVLRILENETWYGRLFVQKEPGEIRKSLLMLFLMFAVLISVAWGFFRKPYIAAAAILMWGKGDAAAALIGIPFGRHKVRLKGTDGKKSWEGSTAMLAVSFICGFCVLYFGHGSQLLSAMLTGLAGALLGAATELFTPSKYDTVTVPAMIAAVLLILGSLKLLGLNL